MKAGPQISWGKHVQNYKLSFDILIKLKVGIHGESELEEDKPSKRKNASLHSAAEQEWFTTERYLFYHDVGECS